MKIAIYYDTMIDKGGAERVAILLANHLGADLITSGFDESIRSWLPIKTTVIDLGNITLKFNKHIGRLFEAPLRFFLNRKRFTYDIHIFLGFSSIYGSSKNHRNIWFCFTPNRILYDLRKSKLAYPNILGRIIFHIYVYLFEPWDQKVVQHNFSKIIAQTEMVKERIKKYYKKSSEVIYSPVDTSQYHYKSHGDYFLTVARLQPEKRIDLIAEAFTQMPDKKLTIVGDGPDKEKIKSLIKAYPNITLLTNKSEAQLIELYANCLATIYMPINEDFGLIPLEGMSSGKACIAVNEGGCREVVIDKQTGYLISASLSNIIDTVNNYSVHKADHMKSACLSRAQKFDVSNCMLNWHSVISSIQSTNTT